MATIVQDTKITIAITGARTNHFSQALLFWVTRQSRAADPLNDIGEDSTTFSDASFSTIDPPVIKIAYF